VPLVGNPSESPNPAYLDRAAGLAAFDIKTHKQQWFFRPEEFQFRELDGLHVEKQQVVMALGRSYKGTYMGVDLKSGTVSTRMAAVT